MSSRLFNHIVVLFVLAGITPVAAQKTRPYYHEDLYPLRPKFEDPIDTMVQAGHKKKPDVVAENTVNKPVDAVLDSINRFNVTRKFIEGYTIQIYSGQNREEAMNSKKKLLTDIPDLTGELEYSQPKFRVKVGSYYSRLEAQKDLYRLKKIFPNAILVPEKILVR
ncbi:MAG: SPOR domain-containing protein [Bacteroidetes bacterium]|nr:SPOR domain-containing protein [Bacteroidota bacterium]